MLLVGSLSFYGWGEPIFLLVVFASALLDWLLGRRIAQRGPDAKACVALGVAANLSGSLTGEFIRQLSASRQYSEIGFHFYYKLHKECAVDGRLSKVRTPGIPADFNREIFAADCLFLEINEASALHPEHHLSAFVTDALARPPDPSAGRPLFRSERSNRTGQGDLLPQTK